MSILKRLFGGGAGGTSDREPELYNDFRIFPEPVKDANGYRIAARIEKEVAGETRVHKLVRADTIQGEDEAIAFSIRKARQVIDEQGEAIF